MRTRPSTPRGFSLIESMIALAVLAVGILGALQATIIVSQSNFGASKRTRATGIAAQVRAGLELHHRDGLMAANFFDICANDIDHLTGELAVQNPPLNTECIVDFDAFDATNQLVSAYSAEDRLTFRRVVVHIRNQQDDPNADLLGIVVSWREGGRIVAHRQYVGLYDRVVISASTEL